MSEHARTAGPRWSGALAFVLAATGSAVGLGNIWKFPYITGEYGGGAFVLVYLACIALIGVPVMIAEILMGRRGRHSPVNALRALAAEAGASRRWMALGWLGILAGFIILSFYSVVAGWSFDYMLAMAGGRFTGSEPEAAAEGFGQLLASPGRLLLWHTVFMLISFGIVARGVRGGLERAVSWLMPLLFALLLLLVGYAAVEGRFAAGLAFLFRPDFGLLTAEGVLVALGHAFFTLSIGLGAIMVYGAYLPQRTSIAGATLAIAGMDTVVALLAGLAIFPVVFAVPGVEPGAGPGLLFQTLPYAFGQIPGGGLFGTLFFLLVIFAALTSGISLLEPVTAYLQERRGWRRLPACALLSVGIWALGIASVLSFNLWSGVHPLGFVDGLAGRTIFDLLDALTSSLLLPLGGLGIAVFVGWVMRRRDVAAELALGEGLRFRLWYWTLRVVSPTAVLVVLLNGLGLI